jgi:hypothetical protein
MDYVARRYDPYLNHFTQPDSIVPDLYNSQSWDRYAYALNNPIRYTDPSGHRECEMTSSGNCMNSRKLKLWQYAADTLNALHTKDDLEAVALIVEKAARLYGTYDAMMPVLSGIFLGVEETNSATIYNAATKADECAALGRPDCAASAELATFGDGGFHEDFQDGLSQPFHFWAYVATAANTEGVGPASYLPGMTVNVAANIYHEIIHPDGAGATWQDFALAIAGSNIGTSVNMGTVLPSQLGNMIRNYVGASGPGAPWISPLIFFFPLPGNR